MHACMNAYIHIYMHAYTHTHMRTYRHGRHELWDDGRTKILLGLPRQAILPRSQAKAPPVLPLKNFKFPKSSKPEICAKVYFFIGFSPFRDFGEPEIDLKSFSTGHKNLSKHVGFHSENAIL